jgi:type II secretory pathway component GspD/PulD (secretin)
MSIAVFCLWLTAAGGPAWAWHAGLLLPAAGEQDNGEEIQPSIAPEQREYEFSFEEIEYADLIDAFSRMTGLPLVGDPPSGKVTFKTTEVMDFKTALNRIRLLLFKHPDTYWLVQTEIALEIVRLTEYSRLLEPEDIFPNVKTFRAAERDKSDLVMVVYSPEKGSVKDLTEIRDFLPDYVRTAQPASPDTNAMYVFALVKDVEKFLVLAKLLEALGEDPRIVKRIPVVHVAPSQVVQSLASLMNLPSDAIRTPRRVRGRGRQSAAQTAAHGIKLLPDDAQQVLIVRALPDEIEEMERILPFVDVEPEADVSPVIITLEHITVQKAVERLRPLLNAAVRQPNAVSSTRRRSQRGRSRRPRSRSTSVAALTTKDVTIVPEPRTSRLFVLGSEQGIARVQQIVALLDVPSDADQPAIVELEHARAANLGCKIEQLVRQMRPSRGSRRVFTVTPDGPSNSLILTGTVLDLELAQHLVDQWDVTGTDPSPHKAHLQHAKASDMVNLLSRVEAAKAQATTPTRGRSRRQRRRTAARASKRGLTSVGKFVGNDSTNMLYVICTDEEWENDYWPRIQELDDDAKPRRLEEHRIEIAEAEPEGIIDNLTRVLRAAGADVPHMVVIADGILVLNASAGQIELIEAVVPEFDVNPDEAAGIQRRIFDIKYADPVQLRDVIMTMMSPAPRPSARRSARSRRARTRRRPPVVATTSDYMRIVSVGKLLIVRARQDKMAAIAELISQVDVERVDETDIRVYPFPGGTNAQAAAQMLSRLIPGSTVSSGQRRGSRSRRSRRPRRETASIMLVPQASSHKVLVSAPIEEFERIEEAIGLLSYEEPALDIVYELMEVEEGNAAELVELIRPFLRSALSQFINEGKIQLPDGATARRRRQDWDLFTIQVDPRGDRLIMAGPQLLITEAKLLVSALDRPDGNESERVVRTVSLEKVDAEEMNNTIQSMLVGRRPPPSSSRRGKGRRSRRLAQQPRATDGPLNVLITPAPGAQALILIGAACDVETVEGWIRHLDRAAAGSGKTIKIYALGDADMEIVVDTIVNVVDTGAVAKRPKRRRAEEGPFASFATEITRKGKHLYINGDTLTGAMLVAATPLKMREVDRIVRLFVGDEHTNPVIPSSQDTLPYMTYELQTVDALDAVYTLESILGVLWPYEDMPQVDYIPFTNILVVKGHPGHFKKVEALIVEYVDNGSPTPAASQSVLSTFGMGMTADDAAMLLKTELERMGLEVEVEQVGSSQEEPAAELERMRP